MRWAKIHWRRVRRRALLFVMKARVRRRALQGACAAAPAVFTPAIIKAVFDEAGAIKAIGLLSSVESLAPAFAPVLGLFLYQAGGWSLSFGVLAILGGFTVLGLTLMRHLVPERSAQPSPSRAATYQRLLVHWPFMSHALSQAASMGAILVFVFAAPVIITQSLGGEPYHFIIMQLLGISGFIAAANASSVLGRKLGVRRLILIGSGMVVLACLALVGLALTGLQSVVLMIVVFIPFNLGLGLRGPSGFLWAMQASEGGDDRAASLIILFAMGLAALGTAIIARYLEIGLLVPALACALITGLALALFISAPTPKS